MLLDQGPPTCLAGAEGAVQTKSERDDHETFYSTKEYAEAWGRAFPRRDRARALRVRGSGPPRTMHVIETYDPLAFSRYVSSGYCADFCLSPGWVGALEARTVKGILWQLKEARTRGFMWKVRFDHEPLAAHLEALGLKYRRQSVHVLHLTKPYEELFAGYSATLRNHVRKAQKRGVTVRQARGLADLVAYHGIYDRLREEKGWAFIYPLELSVELIKLGGRIRFLIAEHEGRVIGGGLFARDGRSVMYWHGATDRAYTHLYPSCAVLDEAVRWALECGAAFFNLGNSGSSATLAQFKSSWGAGLEYNWLFEWHNPPWATASRYTTMALQLASLLNRGVKNVFHRRQASA